MSFSDESNPDGRLNGPADLRQRLHRAFKESSLRLEGERLNRPRDWASMRALVESHRMRMWEAQEVFKQEFNTRVEIRARELIDLRGKKTLDHRHPQGMADRFSPNDIVRQAERDVRHDHEKHLARLRRQREEDMRSFLRGVERKGAMEGKAKDGFNRATNRRAGEDRRSSKDTRNIRNSSSTRPKAHQRKRTRS